MSEAKSGAEHHVVFPDLAALMRPTGSLPARIEAAA
jgi:hypothetical protein